MQTAHALLRQMATQDAPGLPLFQGNDALRLPYGRMHEACGAARVRFALWVAARTQGPVIWIQPSWGAEQISACGMAGIVDPGRFLFVKARRSEDMLWCMEETLRSGAVALAIADVTDVPSITQVRRMHLAAQAGGRGQPDAPLGLLLTPGDGGVQGIESRWSLTPAHDGRGQSWDMVRLRARTAPQRRWRVRQSARQTSPALEAAA